MTDLCFGQRIDTQLGIVEPWYTNPAMDRIKQMDLSDKIIMEWGGGASTIWWGMKAKEVYTVDHNPDWVVRIVDMFTTNKLKNVTVTYVETHEGDQSNSRDEYVKGYSVKPDICIVDGVHRYECAEYAVTHFNPSLLIIDNHQQDYVFMCPALDKLLYGVPMERFIQPDHTDHEGNPWATALFYLHDKRNI
jgi:hypothetical protein